MWSYRPTKVCLTIAGSKTVTGISSFAKQHLAVYAESAIPVGASFYSDPDYASILRIIIVEC